MIKYLKVIRFSLLMKKSTIKIKYDEFDKNEEMPLLTPKLQVQKGKSKLDYIKDFEQEHEKPHTVKTEKIEKKNSYPPLFIETWNLIEKMRSEQEAPVDIYGCEYCPDEKASKEVYNFQTLVSLLLSSQTKDQQTYNAMKRLKVHGLDIDTIRKTSEDTIRDLIYGVSFHNNKTKYIKSVRI